MHDRVVGRAAPRDDTLSTLRIRSRVAVGFAGPAFLVAVGYMDPGNWGTDLAAGSRFAYQLLWVLVVSDAIAIFLQYLSAKLALATGDHLASLIGAQLRRPARVGYWLVAEIAMLATEMAEFLGVVVALRLLLGLPLAPAVLLGSALVLGLLVSASGRLRRLERVIFSLLAVIGVAYVVELTLAGPAVRPILRGAVVPGLPEGSLVVAAGILGATVMPHNLFLHSGLMLTRRTTEAAADLRRATIEIAVALNMALFVNAAILVMAAATFAPNGIVAESLGQAHRTLQPLLGPVAAGAFALALLASGLASATTGSMAGQLVLDGLMGWRVPLVLRRAVTMVPAIVVLFLGVGEVTALVCSQVVLSLTLPIVAGPLVALTGRRALMGGLANRRATRRVGIAVVASLCVLNAALLLDILR